MNPVNTTMSIQALKIARHKTHIRCLRSPNRPAKRAYCVAEKHGWVSRPCQALFLRIQHHFAEEIGALQQAMRFQPHVKENAGESLAARVPAPRGV